MSQADIVNLLKEHNKLIAQQMEKRMDITRGAISKNLSKLLRWGSIGFKLIPIQTRNGVRPTREYFLK